MTEPNKQGSTSSKMTGSEKAADAICENCSCKVEVGGFAVVDVPKPALDGIKPSYKWDQYGHLFIRYTSQDGAQRYYRGGPTNGNSVDAFNKENKVNGTEVFDHSTAKPSGSYSTDETTISDGWWSKVSKFGSIKGHSGLYNGSYEEATYNKGPRGMITIAEGPQHCRYHSVFVRLLREIMALRIEYEAWGPNSNSVVYTILKHAGLPTSKPSGTAFPGWGTDLLLGK